MVEHVEVFGSELKVRLEIAKSPERKVAERIDIQICSGWSLDIGLLRVAETEGTVAGALDTHIAIFGGRRSGPDRRRYRRRKLSPGVRVLVRICEGAVSNGRSLPRPLSGFEFPRFPPSPSRLAPVY